MSALFGDLQGIVGVGALPTLPGLEVGGHLPAYPDRQRAELTAGSTGAATLAC